MEDVYKRQILPLVHAFLRKYNAVFGLEVQDISEEALDILQDYAWPGNVRELETVSYTHLDVYKRQGLFRAARLPDRF